MLLIPAIDLKDGRCVRLRQGRMAEGTVFSDDPPAVARRWREAGAERLHVVDLDGAVRGAPVHAETVAGIVAAFGAPVQVGGGIRSVEAAAAYLSAGVRYVIIGTRAVNEPTFVTELCAEFPGRIIAGLDVRDGRLAVEGWSKLSAHSPLDLAQRFEQDGAEAVVFTDVSRDGMLSGVNAEATAALAAELAIPVIAAGGVGGVEDIHRLGRVADSGILGVIAGRALYDGSLDIGEGLAAAAAYADVFAVPAP